MPRKKLTDETVQRLKAEKGERVDYFDTFRPGFGLRVSGATPKNPEGRKTWMLFYRFGGKQHRLTFEPGYPALTLKDARDRAGAALDLIAKGIDPAQHKAEVKAENARKRDTFETVVDQFIKRQLEGKNRAPRYIEETRRNFNNHVLPRWKDMDIKAITRRDVIELLDKIVDEGSDIKDKDGKKKHIDGGPIAANRVLAGVRALFNWAMRRGIIKNTPASLVERPGKETRREHVLTADELRAIWPTTEALGTPINQFLRALILLGQRREETAGMRWADLDFEAKTWTIPAELTKAGRVHVVPLPPAVVDMLKAMPRKTFINADKKAESSRYVFTVGGKASISNYSAIKARLDAKITATLKEADADAKPLAPWTVHDLRRTAATEMGRLGVSRFIIGKVLNHSDRSVTGIYDRHSYLAEKRNAMETWASYVDGLINPKPDNVVELRPAAEAVA